MNVSFLNSFAMNVSAPAESSTAHPQSEDERTLIYAVKAVNASEMLGRDNELTFVLDLKSRRAVVRIVNKRTGEALQQIPAEYVLRMAEEMKRG
jgi:uncharacterized FlaG/YvyC family protein